MMGLDLALMLKVFGTAYDGPTSARPAKLARAELVRQISPRR